MLYPVRKGSVWKGGDNREDYKEMRVGFKIPSELSNGVYAKEQACISCGLCARSCPKGAIVIIFVKKHIDERRV